VIAARRDDARLAELIRRFDARWVAMLHLSDTGRARAAHLLKAGWVPVYVDNAVLVLVQERSVFVGLVPNVRRSSDGEVKYQGKEQLYSYRTIPRLGLLVLRPASVKSAAWRPFLTDPPLAALAGVGLAAVLSFLLARSIVRPAAARADASLAADERHERPSRRGQPSLPRSRRRSTRWSEQLTRRAMPSAFLFGQSRAQDPADRDPRLRGGPRRGCSNQRGSARDHDRERPPRAVCATCSTLARMNLPEFSVRSEAADLQRSP
jgi:hypothetical protein